MRRTTLKKILFDSVCGADLSMLCGYNDSQVKSSRVFPVDATYMYSRIYYATSISVSCPFYLCDDLVERARFLMACKFEGNKTPIIRHGVRVCLELAIFARRDLEEI